MTTKTIKLDEDLARETLLALRDRHFLLMVQRDNAHADIAAIATRQLARVSEAGFQIALALGETF